MEPCRKIWSSETLDRGLGLVSAQTLSMEDPGGDTAALERELADSRLHCYQGMAARPQSLSCFILLPFWVSLSSFFVQIDLLLFYLSMVYIPLLIYDMMTILSYVL